MKINVTIDTKNLQAKTQREAKRLAFSTAQALNRTAERVQLAERANLDRKFTVRKHEFMYRLIKIKQWASPKQNRPWVEVFIDTSKSRVLLSLFEEGGDRPPAKGKQVAVPITGEAARPSFEQPVAEGLTFRAMGLKKPTKKANKRSGGWLHEENVLEGKLGTFELPKVGVFQRLAGQLKAALIYAFVKKPHLKPRLDFRETASATFNEEFAQQFDRAYRS